MSTIPEQDRITLMPLPHLVTFPFQSEWGVVTPFVYRYEDQNWIDEFFETGKLRLSTFAKFATYADEVRGDTDEGKALCLGITGDNKTVAILQRQGISAVILCCSHSLSRAIGKGFGRNSAFKIINTSGFCFEISRQLLGFRKGFEGSCIYRSDTSIKRSIDVRLSELGLPGGAVPMEIFVQAAEQLGGPELLLMKRKQYANQQEYRLLWELDALHSGYVDVCAPLARQYCRRIEADEWSD